MTLGKGKNGAMRDTPPGISSCTQKFPNPSTSNPVPSPSQFNANATERHVRSRVSNATPVTMANVAEWKTDRDGVVSSALMKSARTPAPKNRSPARFNLAGGLTGASMWSCLLESLHASQPLKAMKTSSASPPGPIRPLVGKPNGPACNGVGDSTNRVPPVVTKTNELTGNNMTLIRLAVMTSNVAEAAK